MKILVTNDDGVGAEGLETLVEFLEREHEVWVVAPNVERSGTSHGITLRDAVRISQLSARRFSCAGTPADCVLFSLLGAVPVEPDMVVSGINHGPNIGTDIIYSGTVAGARQAALMGVPAVAVSVAGEPNAPMCFTVAADFMLRNLKLMAELAHPDHFLNINVPNSDEAVSETVVTPPARRIYRDQLVDFTAPNGERYFFLQGSLSGAHIEKGSDWETIQDGKISVSPIYLHPINHTEDRAYRNARFQAPQPGNASV